jgi:hypothetical protein
MTAGRRWSAAEKARKVEESLAPDRVTGVARRFDVHPICFICGDGKRTGLLSAGADNPARFVPFAVARDSVGVGSVIEVVLRKGRVLRPPEGVTPARAVILVHIPTIVTTDFDASRPAVPIDRDQCEGAVRCIF